MDFLFDGIRVTWLTIIGCILFLPDLPVERTFAIGAHRIAWRWGCVSGGAPPCPPKRAALA